MAVPPAWAPTEITPETVDGAPRPSSLVEFLSDTAATAEMLVAAKAIVFRGFGLTAGDLDDVMDLLLSNRLAYVHGNSPRTKVGDNVYTSTEYPAAYTISMHNEMSYSARWPGRLLFFCDRAPETGGATPVVDGAAWLAALGDDIGAAFAGGVTYTQNLHGGKGFGRSWQDTFETTDRSTVDGFLAAVGADWRWHAGGLRVSHTRPATVRHPVTGAEVWFNQADQWHLAGLADETARALLQIMTEDDLPQNVTFADGSPIPADHIRRIQECGLSTAVDVDWGRGDLLVIDNVLVGHGRRPYTGDRRILVAMSD
jgi:alpha-ketoglutarate-dependent taurine dioxygenase